MCSTCTRTSSSNAWHNRVNTYAIQGSKIMQLVFSILCVNCDYCMLFINTSWLKKISTIMHEYFPNIYCPVYFLVLIFFPLWHDNLAWLVLLNYKLTKQYKCCRPEKNNVLTQCHICTSYQCILIFSLQATAAHGILSEKGIENARNHILDYSSKKWKNKIFCVLRL